MGLAEPKRKQKLSFDPNNTTWGSDTNKFGYQLMNKMGWQDGQGLGKNKDGQKDHIKVRVKNNALGVGAKKGNDDNWIELQASFNNLLENLTKSHELGVDNSSVKVSALEEKASTSRRIFYSRFTKAKDVSKYSDADMASIFGERSKTDSPPPASEDGEASCVFTGVTTTTNALSINDYFAQRLAERRAAAGKPVTDSAVTSESPTPQTASASEVDSDSGKDSDSGAGNRKRKAAGDDGEGRAGKKKREDKGKKSKKSSKKEKEKGGGLSNESASKKSGKSKEAKAEGSKGKSKSKGKAEDADEPVADKESKKRKSAKSEKEKTRKSKKEKAEKSKEAVTATAASEGKKSSKKSKGKESAASLAFGDAAGGNGPSVYDQIVKGSKREAAAAAEASGKKSKKSKAGDSDKVKSKKAKKAK